MSEKIKTEHSDDVDFGPVPAGMMEMISSADVKKAEKPGIAERMLGRFAIRTAAEWEEEDRLDEEEIKEIIAAEEAGEEGGDDDAEILEKAFGTPIERVDAAMGEDERLRVAAEALRLARKQSEGAYHSFIRDTAGIHGLVADDLLTATRLGVKEMMYDDERRKSAVFAMTVRGEDLEQLIARGELEREEDEQDLMTSNLRSVAYQSGEAKDTELTKLKPGEVRIFLGEKLIDEESFDCLLGQPTVDRVVVEACLGVAVEGDREEERKWTEMLERYGVALPVYDGGLGAKALSLDFLQATKAGEMEKLAARDEEKRLEREASTNVSEDGVTKVAESYASRLDDETMDEVFLAYQKSTEPREFHEAEKMAHDACCAAWRVEEKPELRYTENEKGPAVRWYYDGEAKKPVVEINEAQRTMGDASESIDLIARGDFREVQQELVEKLEKGAEGLSEAEAQRAQLYKWDLEHAKDSGKGVVAKDVEGVGEACREALYGGFERKHASLRKNPFAWIQKKAESGRAA